MWITKSYAEIKDEISVARSNGKLHYVYILHRPNNEPFYVGKGQRNRIFCHEQDARNTSKKSHKLNVIRSIHNKGETIRYSIHKTYVSEKNALEEERNLIQRIGRHDQKKGPLTNQTDGGEGTLNISEQSKYKKEQALYRTDADDADVAYANKFVLEFVKVKSNPIKSLTKYKNSIGALYKNRDYLNMSNRAAGALVVMAVAQSVMLKPGAELARRFEYNSVQMILENGCGRDMLVNGMIELTDVNPKSERFRITQAGFDFIVKIYGKNQLTSYGIYPIE